MTVGTGKSSAAVWRRRVMVLRRCRTFANPCVIAESEARHGGFQRQRGDLLLAPDSDCRSRSTNPYLLSPPARDGRGFGSRPNWRVELFINLWSIGKNGSCWTGPAQALAACSGAHCWCNRADESSRWVQGWKKPRFLKKFFLGF